MTTTEDLPEADARYTRIAIALHWVAASLILLNLAIGPFMESFAEPCRTTLARLHESSGITILLLTVVRIVWRVFHRPPRLDPRLSWWEQVAAKAVHGTLYVAMVAMPLLGWAIISANPPQVVSARVAIGTAPAAKPKRIMIWGLVPLIPIKSIQAIALERDGKPRQRALHGRLVSVHALGGYLMMLLLALHLLGAFKHEWFDGRGGLRRIGVGRRRDRDGYRQPPAE
ncbi:cytochrome b/b6 domain-containing protein [Sphingomonas sp. RT2P30]|uniref:cytochrome b n=1 Tax=Parasphingomonas halimpatiens TaxID=3096162 RepID=UPI002FC5B448